MFGLGSLPCTALVSRATQLTKRVAIAHPARHSAGILVFSWCEIAWHPFDIQVIPLYLPLVEVGIQVGVVKDRILPTVLKEPISPDVTKGKLSKIEGLFSCRRTSHQL